MVFSLTLYRVILPLHILAVLAAYGLPFAYPLVIPYLRRHHPETMAAVHEMQHKLNLSLTGPASVFIVGFGAYMATKGHDWSKAWLDVPLTLFVLISIIGAAYIVPVTRRLAELAAVDIGGNEYARTYRAYLAVEMLLGLFVAAAIFFMAAKPFS